MNIKIVIADDHPMIIDGLQKMLSGYDHITLINAYTTGTELLEGLEHQLPDVLLLDIQMPDISGDELALVIQKKYPEVKMLTLTNFDSALYINNMLRNGASGYLLKRTDKKTLIKAIEAVYRGEIFLEPAIREKAQQLNTHARKDVYSHLTLTMREKQILGFVMQGLTSQEISGKLFLSIKSIEHYRARLFIKLEVKNLAALITKALQLGLAE